MRVNAAVHRLALLLVAALVIPLAGCGGRAEPAEQRTAPGFPRSVDNCGQPTEVEAPPRRVVSLNQGSTEILLALGLADRVVGTAMWSDPLPDDLAEAGRGVPRLAANEPSYESVLATEPELVTASFEATLGPGGVTTREQLGKLGVPSYLAPSDCAKDNSGPGDGVRTTDLTMDPIYGEVRDLALLFGVEDRGERLIAELRARMDRATRDLRATDASVAYWFANSESPYVAGCCGAPGIITDALGAKNVFDDTRAEWPQVNWEVLAERNPDVLVLGDLTRESQTAESARAKIEFLESNPVTRNMTAVREKRYVLLSGQAMNPTIRTVAGVEKVAAQLRELGMAG